MKTAVTVIDTIQTGMDNYKDVKTTKVFEDSATILDIKEWISMQGKHKVEVDKIGLSAFDISDVE